MSLHVIFGGGQVGQPLARILRERGRRVRIVKRSSGAPEGTELMQGDATDQNFCQEAARGASTVYHCMNPPYSARIWAEVIPKYIDNMITAAGRSDARLVVLENVYMLGRTAGRPMNEDTPMNPCSRKGEIRAREVERLFEATAPAMPNNRSTSRARISPLRLGILRIHGCVFVHRAPARASQHVHVFEHHQPRVASSCGRDHIVDVFRNYFGPDAC